MSPEEERLENDAFQYVKAHAKDLVHKYAGHCIAVPHPVSLFMAGSPGAGKTEVSKSLMGKFETVPIRIDADDIRAWCPGYVGSNAHVFQKAANKGVNILYDHALHNNKHLILDGTFAYADSRGNIQRSLDYDRKAELWFIYQDPLKAWEVTKAREAIEARRVSKEVFVNAFFRAKDNARAAKATFGNSLTLNLLVKNIDSMEQDLRLNMQADELDRYISCAYTQDELVTLLHD